MLELETLIERRVARVGVVGLGYVGLPLAVEFAKAGFGVVGIDVDRRKVERVLRGENAEVNGNMPYFVAQKTTRALAAQGRALSTSKVLVLGVAFKRDVGDIRNSSALRLMELLAQDGATISYHDPYVPELQLRGKTLQSVELTPAALAAADCVLIHTDHSVFRWESIVPHCRLVLDTRNATHGVPNTAGVVVKL